jgi:hypothetical protein
MHISIDVAPTTRDHVPAGHAVQPDPLSDANVPAGQMLQANNDVEPSESVDEPTGQATQLRTLLAPNTDE